MLRFSRLTKTVGIVVTAALCLGISNIDNTLKFSWGENIGWLNWYDANGGVDGVVVGPQFLSGYIWAENIGYIHVGDGSGPYPNTNGSDYGVNIGAGPGNLDGLGWGENIGWINFDTAAALGSFSQQARYDSSAGRFRGYAWGENVGWINLDDSTHYVATALLNVTAAISRKTHGGAGTFNVNIFGTGLTECRQSGPTTLIVTFSQPVQGVGGLDNSDVSLSSGSVSGVSISANELTIQMSGATPASLLTVAFPGIESTGGLSTTDTLCVRVLVGDAASGGATNIFDLIQIRNNLNQTVTAANFRNDVNADGNINIFDLIATRNALNNTVAACP